MGQYYKPTNIDNKEWLYSHDYGNGLKLTEHSYIGNDFVSAVENLLIPAGRWYKARIVWAGDYADGEPELEADENGNKPNLYHLCEDDKKIEPETRELPPEYRYLCNHSKKVFIDYTTIKQDESGWTINPIPLLTCEGNGRGGGDFRGEDSRVGTWARDSISIESSIPEGYTSVDGTFSEEVTPPTRFSAGKSSAFQPDIIVGGQRTLKTYRVTFPQITELVEASNESDALLLAREQAGWRDEPSSDPILEVIEP